MADQLQPFGQGSAGGTDVVTQLQNIARQIGLLVAAFKGRPTYGSFTMAAAPTTTVLQPAVQANSFISWENPINASAANLIRLSKSPYLSSISPGISFTIATADGTNAAGTEQFSYSVTTPT